MATRARNAKGHFVKRSRAMVHQPRTKTKIVRAPAKRRRSGGGALVVVAPPRKVSRRRRGMHHGVTPGKILGAGLVLANVCETNNGFLGSTVYDVVQKIPGSKTFGGAATAGLVCGAVYKFTRFGGRARPWLAAAGIIGLAAAAVKVGVAGTSFKWLGDPDGDPNMDVDA